MTRTEQRSLDQLRREIDGVDDDLVGLISRRLELGREIAQVKAATGEPVMQPQRVEEVQARVLEVGRSHRVPEDYLRSLYDLIIAATCAVESDGTSRQRIEPEGSGAEGLPAVGLDHVAIAVPDLELAIEYFTTRLGFEIDERRTVDGEKSGMVTAVMKAGSVKLVLVQGTSPESNVSRYIEHYGPGVQHLAIEVPDVDAVVGQLGDRDCAMLTGTIKSPGLHQAFTARDAATGMQIEFIARVENDGFADSNVQELFAAMERADAY